MPRVPYLTAAGLDAEQRGALDAMEGRDRIGEFYGVLLRSPETALAVQRLIRRCRTTGSVRTDVRECVTAAMGVMLHSPYMVESHIAAMRASAPAAVADRVLAGDLGALPGEIGVAVDLAREICVDRHVADETYARAARAWSAEELVDLIVLIGTNQVIASVLLAFDITRREPDLG